MENYLGSKPNFVGLSGCVSNPAEKDLPEIYFRQYRFEFGGIEDRTPPFLNMMQTVKQWWQLLTVTAQM